MNLDGFKEKTTAIADLLELGRTHGVKSLAFEGVSIEWHPDDVLDDDDGDDDDGDEADVDDGTGFKSGRDAALPRWRGFTKRPAKAAAEKVTPEQVAEVVNLAKDLDAWNEFEAPSVVEGDK